jgi:hypothetical protein
MAGEARCACFCEHVPPGPKRGAPSSISATIQNRFIVEYENNHNYVRCDFHRQAKIKAAEAEAEAIRIQREALRSSAEIIELRKIESMNNGIEKWDGHQPTVTMRQSSMPPMLDLSSVANADKR